MIPLNVTSQVFIAKYALFKDNYDVVGFVNDIARRDSNTTLHHSECRQFLKMSRLATR